MVELRNPKSRRETLKEVNCRIVLTSDVWSVVAQAEGDFKQGFRHRMAEKNEDSPQRIKTSRSHKGRKVDFVWIRYTHFMAGILVERSRRASHKEFARVNTRSWGYVRFISEITCKLACKRRCICMRSDVSAVHMQISLNNVWSGPSIQMWSFYGSSTYTRSSDSYDALLPESVINPKPKLSKKARNIFESTLYLRD